MGVAISWDDLCIGVKGQSNGVISARRSTVGRALHERGIDIVDTEFWQTVNNRV